MIHTSLQQTVTKENGLDEIQDIGFRRKFLYKPVQNSQGIYRRHKYLNELREESNKLIETRKIQASNWVKYRRQVRIWKEDSIEGMEILQKTQTEIKLGIKISVRQRVHWKALSTAGSCGRQDIGLEDEEEELHHSLKANGVFNTNRTWKEMANRQVTSRAEGEFQI